MRITHTATTRDEALVSLGPHWPAPPGATVTRISGAVAIEHGAVSVHDTDDQPGTTWWAVDGLIVPQGAGPAPMLPGCPTVTVPAPDDAAPPLT